MEQFRRMLTINEDLGLFVNQSPGAPTTYERGRQYLLEATR